MMPESWVDYWGPHRELGMPFREWRKSWSEVVPQEVMDEYFKKIFGRQHREELEMAKHPGGHPKPKGTRKPKK